MHSSLWLPSGRLAWGIAACVRWTAIPALLGLSIEMLGAIYTHYHNYFSKGFPDPFGNSLDALRTLFLMIYLLLALAWRRREELP